MATDARQQASKVASEASHQARNLAGEARHAVEDQARGQAHRLAETLDGMGGKLQALAHGEADRAGELTEYVDDLGRRLHGVSERLETQGLEGVIDDVQRFARRRPGMFLVSAAAAGFLAGRLARGARQADGQESGPQPATAPAGAGATTPTGPGTTISAAPQDTGPQVAHAASREPGSTIGAEGTPPVPPAPGSQR
ncbi:MAG: hypothetical protein ACLFXM_14505 [Acidimicrobiia bacterium]